MTGVFDIATLPHPQWGPRDDKWDIICTKRQASRTYFSRFPYQRERMDRERGRYHHHFFACQSVREFVSRGRWNFSQGRPVHLSSHPRFLNFSQRSWRVYINFKPREMEAPLSHSWSTTPYCERSEQLWLRVKGPNKQRQILNTKLLSGIFLNTL